MSFKIYANISRFFLLFKVPVMNYMQISGNDGNRSLQTGGILNPHPPASSLMPLSPVTPLQVPYSSMRDETKVSQQENIQHMLEVPIPPPEFYNEDYEKKDSKCVEETTRGREFQNGNISETGSFCHFLPHVYQPCSAYNTPHIHPDKLNYRHDHCKEISKSRYCDFAPKNCDNNPQKSHDFSISSLPRSGMSALGRHFASQGKQCPRQAFPYLSPRPCPEAELSNISDRNVTSQSALHYGTLKRGEGCTSERRGSRGSTRGSMPDVRGQSSPSETDPSSGKSKRESAV